MGERKNIRVFSPGFEFLCEIDDYEQLLLHRVFAGYGDFEIRIGASKPNAGYLKPGNIISLDAGPAGSVRSAGEELPGYAVGPGRSAGAELLGHASGIIEYWERTQDRKSEGLSVKGYTLERVLNRRITYPAAGAAFWEMTGPAESVIKALINRNLGAGAEAGRAIPEVAVPQDKGRGAVVTVQTAYRPLDEEVRRVCMDAGVGIAVNLDAAGKKFTAEVVFGADRTAGQSALPPVVFSAEFDNILEQKLVESALDYRNTAITGGKGDGVTREIVTVYENAPVAGMDRREMFADIRDSAVTSAMLPDRGREALGMRPAVAALDGKVNPFHSLVYGRDYFLGDIVTRAYGLAALDTRITEVTEAWDAKGYTLECVFGNRMPTLLDKIKGGIGQ
ncbi:MAG: siphovirus ReqiPepy6 Gp37-like family protein [Firmicutes bacterium]|nr:siphovirus ReqiPepy6 Gp37-like family protein [Bacillota bacterium]